MKTSLFLSIILRKWFANKREVAHLIFHNPV
jgi:hypothetical protein